MNYRDKYVASLVSNGFLLITLVFTIMVSVDFQKELYKDSLEFQSSSIALAICESKYENKKVEPVYIEKPIGEEIVPCSNSSFKSYMSYKSITDKSSLQYKLQEKSYTNSEGFRMYGDYYEIALGTYYKAVVGDKYLIKLDSGVSFYAIVGDIKSDNHTNGCVTTHDKSMLEFIVDLSKISDKLKLSGNANDYFEGSVVSIIKLYE